MLGHDALVTAANWVYIWAHWPLIGIVALLLYRRRRVEYRILRNAFFVSGAVGFVFFALVPVAPPRLLDGGLVDTIAEQSRAYRALQPPSLTNPYAAFPSLHVGWNVLVGIVLFRSFHAVAARTFAVATPLGMAVAVVATGNHYVLDACAGAVIVVLALRVSLALADNDGKLEPAPAGGRAG